MHTKKWVTLRRGPRLRFMIIEILVWSFFFGMDLPDGAFRIN